MLPKQLPVKTEYTTFTYRSHKAATPGVKEDACCQKKDMSMKKKTHGETLRCNSFKLYIVQHNCCTYLLHHHKPSTAEESMSPFASTCAMSFKP